jgi:hypothetical protein
LMKHVSCLVQVGSHSLHFSNGEGGISVGEEVLFGLDEVRFH